MSKKEDILGVLAGESGPMNRAVMAKKIGKPTSDWQKQLNGFAAQGLVIKTPEMEYSLTEAGYEFLRASPPESLPASGEVTPEPGDVTPPGEVTDETLKTTEYQQFITFGKTTGVATLALIEQTAKHVWSGGDFRDVAWVWHGLTQMGIRPDLAQRWWHSWRSFLHQPIPPDLAESVGTPTPGEGVTPGKPGGRDYIIAQDEPVRVGANLGDYSLQDAKDILAIRALRYRFSGAGQPAAGVTPQSDTKEKVSEILTALSPYLNKESKSDIETLKEVIADKLALQRQEILSQIPQQGQPTQPKPLMEQVTGFIAAMSSLKEAGPMIKSILGIQDSPSNQSNIANPTQIIGLDGQPAILDLTSALDLRKFLATERREEERHQAMTGFIQTARENIPDGIQAILQTVSEAKGGPKTKSTGKVAPSQVYKCGDCQAEFSIPPEADPNLPVNCPGCGRQYSREELNQ